jgi:hypothetical protein
MASAPKVIDIDDRPELLDLAREVKETGESRELRAEGEAVALVVPMVPVDSSDDSVRSFPWRKKTEADYEAFRSAAGGWKDVDTGRLIEDVYADRRSNDCPPIDL